MIKTARSSDATAREGGETVDAAPATRSHPVLALRDLSKTFGGTAALKNVALTVGAGEVHGLLGENGSGKSTLIKVLSGFHAPEHGATVEFNGEAVAFPLAPGQFRSLGLAFVHQDLGLIPELSVLENLRVGTLVARRGRWISWSRESRRAQETFARFGIVLDPSAQVGELTSTERALLAIVRAVEEIREGQATKKEGPGLLVLDETTVFLPREGVEQLFALVRSIVKRGEASVLFVSHDLDEIREVTDRVTVLRDGRVQGSVDTSATSERQLVEMIIGRTLAAPTAPPVSKTGEQPVEVTVRDLSGEAVEQVAFDVRRGEILGLTGLLGSGFEDIPYLLFGARRCRSGTLGFDGATFDLRSLTPDRAVSNGVALVPAERQRDGCVPELPVGENVMLEVLSRYHGRFGLRTRRMSNDAEFLLERFDVRPRDPDAAYDALSGGNQQKALLAKWLQSDPRLVLLHEPTNGVDVGARAQIFSILRAATEAGACVVCASSDYEQLAVLCDRVLVMARGRIVHELAGQVTKERIAERVYGSVTLRETTREVET
jgi:ribose transport system ATP-binding protein